MHQSIVEVGKLVEELAETKRQLADAQRTAEYAKRDAVDTLKSEMLQRLIESDIKREVAIAKLDAYEKAANKDDINKEIRGMLSIAITGLSAKPQGQPQKGGNQQPNEQK